MILLNCPHCQQLIEIEQINCGIFRCGIYRQTGQQIPPHHPKSECDRLTEQNLIYGCGKPFRIQVEKDNEEKIIYTAIPCDYI